MTYIKSPNPHTNKVFKKRAGSQMPINRNIDYGELYFRACNQNVPAERRRRLLDAFIANPSIINSKQSVDDEDD